jgi:hypothetical protein
MPYYIIMAIIVLLFIFVEFFIDYSEFESPPSTDPAGGHDAELQKKPTDLKPK